MNARSWLFNTDETEPEGEGAHKDMIDLSVIAAWGSCRGSGARLTLDKPADGETIFYFLARHGIIASGEVSGAAFPSDKIFGKTDEFHRTITNLRQLPRPLSVAEIREGSGYDLPCRHIVCQLNDEDGVRFILDHFQSIPVA